MVLGPLAATILSIERCAASSLLFSIFSKPLTSGCVLQIGGGKSRAAARVASEVVINPKTHSLMIRIPHSFNGFRCGIIRGGRAALQGIAPSPLRERQGAGDALAKHSPLKRASR